MVSEVRPGIRNTGHHGAKFPDRGRFQRTPQRCIQRLIAIGHRLAAGGGKITLAVIAERTGGRALYNTNNLTDTIRTVQEDT